MNIIKDNNIYFFRNATEILKTLPVGVYDFESGMMGPFLVKVNDFVFPKKIYNNDTKFINHLLKTWKESSDSIGCLLTGGKGLGKSFTANYICKKLGIPVIKITKSISRDAGLISFLNDIHQPHIVYIDEFEKIFPKAVEEGDLGQEMFLSYLDGSNSSGIKRLFIITSNDDISSFFMNRPTRLRYVKEYTGLSQEVIKEIVDDRLKENKFLEDLIQNVDADCVNIDVLIKIIDEVNLHSTPYTEFKDFFNFKSQGEFSNVSLIFEDSKNKKHYIDLAQLHHSTLSAMKTNKNFQPNFGDFYHGKEEYYAVKTIGEELKNIDKYTSELAVDCLCYENSKKNFKAKVRIEKPIKQLVY